MLGFLGSKVLGQFDPFHEPSGRLLLVAPNIVHVERELGVDPTDFRLWVCLHEETHRVQFTANPWLRRPPPRRRCRRSPTRSSRRALLDEAPPRRRRRSAAATAASSTSSPSPEQKEILDRVTGVMSLLEGHADVVMDGVGPTVIPSVGGDPREVQPAPQGRRQPRQAAAHGCSASTPRWRSTATGPSSCATSSTRSAWTEFNAIWTGPETLPSKAEINDPDAWIARVL